MTTLQEPLIPESWRVEELFAAMARMTAVELPAPMSPEEMVEEIAAMRAERRRSGKE